MACRAIYDEGNNFIRKIIPFDGITDEFVWPTISEIINEPSCLDEIFEKCECSKRIKQAIYQQYNEIILYEITTCDEKKVLAPQCDISYTSKNNLPIIIYPRFTPIFEDEEVWKLNEEELTCLMGLRCGKFGISETELLFFLKEVQKLCINYNLREDDILKNPSNIGYHSVLGLRVIDYGLAEESCVLML